MSSKYISESDFDSVSEFSMAEQVEKIKKNPVMWVVILIAVVALFIILGFVIAGHYKSSDTTVVTDDDAGSVTEFSAIPRHKYITDALDGYSSSHIDTSSSKVTGGTAIGFEDGVLRVPNSIEASGKPVSAPLSPDALIQNFAASGVPLSLENSSRIFSGSGGSR